MIARVRVRDVPFERMVEDCNNLLSHSLPESKEPWEWARGRVIEILTHTAVRGDCGSTHWQASAKAIEQVESAFPHRRVVGIYICERQVEAD